MGEKFRPKPPDIGVEKKHEDVPVDLDDPRVMREIMREGRAYLKEQQRLDRAAERQRRLKKRKPVQGGIAEVAEDTELTEQDRIQDALDKLYPNAKTKTIVTYEGHRYRISYRLYLSRSHKTRTWEHHWELLDQNVEK